MESPKRFAELPEYAFPRLRRLLGDAEPGRAPVDMTIGSPRHSAPGFVAGIVAAEADAFRGYPPNDGAPELLEAVAAWLLRRYGWRADPATDLMALNGTREGLYNLAMALCPEEKRGRRPVVLTPNPFYQVYAVAALSVGAEPVYVNASAATGHLPDYHALPPDVLDRTALAYVCSPANPQGAVADLDWWTRLLELAERHDFIVVADECYSEIWRDAPPPGVLEAVRASGADPERVVALHSLSKRSNLAGLRSGFVVSGPRNMARIRQLRAYSGAPLPLPLQMAAAAAWSDEAHVEENRALYRAKFDAAEGLFGAGAVPPAGFFLWLPVPSAMGDGEAAAATLWRGEGVRVLPGAYLARDGVEGGRPAGNPGTHFIRVALCAPHDETVEGLTRLAGRMA